MRAAAWVVATVTAAGVPIACGLQSAGTQAAPDGAVVDALPPEGAAHDAIVDITVQDQGQGVTEAGLPCECVTASDLAGATIVAYASSMRGACPTGYDGAAGTDVESYVPPAPSTCTCAPATATPTRLPSCTSQTLNFDIKTGQDQGRCTNTPDYSNSIAASEACNNAGRNVNPGGQKADWVSFRAQSGPTPVGGACGPNVAGGVPVPVSPKLGRTCALSAAVGSCGSNLACVPLAPSPWGQCLEVPSEATCPASFPFPHSVGSAVTDTRACPPCTGDGVLNPGSCTTPKISVYTDAACTAIIAPSPIDANGVCQNVNWDGGKDIRGARYTSQSMGASCAGAPGFPTAPTGAVTLAGEKKLCCRAWL
jgi:hypothetical protein